MCAMLPCLPKIYVLAREYSLLLLDSYNRVRHDAIARMGISVERLPDSLLLPV